MRTHEGRAKEEEQVKRNGIIVIITIITVYKRKKREKRNIQRGRRDEEMKNKRNRKKFRQANGGARAAAKITTLPLSLPIPFSLERRSSTAAAASVG